ncbi:MAG: hypothetical protein V4729_02750 [Pseudomonadota bacterium]
MKAFWALFWSVCQMRRAPADVPWSLPLLALVALLNISLAIATQFLGGSVQPIPAVATVFVAAVLDVAGYGLLLAFKRQELQYVQGLTATWGADLVLGLFALPLALAGRLAGTESPLLGVVVFGQMLLVGWNLGVRGFIYHRSAHVGIFQGNMLALTLFLLNVFIAFRLFPELFAAPGAR